MNYEIRPMQPRDVLACLDLWRNFGEVVLRKEADQPEALERFLCRNPGLSFVAVDHGTVVGSVLCGHDGRRASVYHLAVRRQQRRSRCATALLEATVQALAAEGITSCNAYVRRRNFAAMAFWSSIGATLRKDTDTVRLTVRVGRPATRAIGVGLMAKNAT